MNNVTYQIHPTIGICRIGNSEGENDHFIGPDGDDANFPPRSFRDPEGRIRRQAARFRVLRVEQRDDGAIKSVEINPREARIVWTLTLCNRKGVGRRLERKPKQAKYRNNATPNDLIKSAPLIIQPPLGKVSLKSKEFPEHHFLDGGAFLERPVRLGEIRVDNHGRLLVLGGTGISGYVPKAKEAPPRIEGFADNDRWFDDTSDGIVQAQVEFFDDREGVEAKSAWVLVGPPDFAPEIRNLITLHDLAFQKAADRELRSPPEIPDFVRDIKPILDRVFNYQWVNKYAAARHGTRHPYDFNIDFWKKLGDPVGEDGLRRRLFEKLRDPNSPEEESGITDMPRLHDDINKFRDYNPKRVLPFLPFQYKMLEKWRDGHFTGIGNPAKATPESLTDKIDRASLESCVGGPFYPGIETWDIIREPQLWAGTKTDPFRLNVENQDLVPGKLTEGNALPWQSDFLDCKWEDGAGWWPAERPDHVRIEPDSPIMQDWSFGLHRHKNRPPGRSKNAPQAEDMIDYWSLLGFVVKKQDSNGNDVFVEDGRDPNHELPSRQLGECD